MASNQVFLINGLNPPKSNEFQVREGAVRLFGAALGVIYNIQVYVGDQTQGAWVDAYFNSTQLQLSDTNNILVIFISGQYRIVTSDSSDPAADALVWFVEADETDHDNRVMYVLQTPAPPGGGSGGGPSPSDDLPQEVGNGTGELERGGTPGTAITYSRSDHSHPFSCLPDSVATAAVSFMGSSTAGTDPQYVINTISISTVCLTRETVTIVGQFDVSSTSIGKVPQVVLPSTRFTDPDTGIFMGLIDISCYPITNSFNLPIPGIGSVGQGLVQVIGNMNVDVLDTQWSIEVTATFALEPQCQEGS